MTDYTELKHLTQALGRAIEQAEHKPGQWAETAQSMGGVCSPGEPFQIGKPWAKEEPWANFSYKRDSWLAVQAVNALPKLLALVAAAELTPTAQSLLVERDRLQAEVQRLEAKVASLTKERDKLARDNQGLLEDFEGAL